MIVSIESSVEDYLRKINQAINENNPIIVQDCPINLDESIFKLLTSDKFTHISRGKAQRFKDPILVKVKESVEQNKELSFYLDFGGGYHASINPKNPELNFNVGLGELLTLYQIKSFQKEAMKKSNVPLRWHLIIDNQCAYHVNNIPVQNTTDYCNQLRNLIQNLDMGDLVDVIVESEHFKDGWYVHQISGLPDDITNLEHDNVIRFLGKQCSQEEAKQRIAEYKSIGAISERLLSQFYSDGIHLIQRTNEQTLGFRSFPGGDSRIQCGQVALKQNPNGHIIPILITSRNFDEYGLTPFQNKDLVPEPIKEIYYAAKK